MKSWLSICAISTGLIVLAGCQTTLQQRYAPYRLGPAQDVVTASVEAIGGVEAWNNAGKVRATAVITDYTQNGASIYAEHLVLDMLTGAVQAQAELPAGFAWTATAQNNQFQSTSPALAADNELRNAVSKQLLLQSCRLNGPMALLQSGKQVLSVDRLSIGGERLIRVRVSNDRSLARAYYFDAQNHLLRHVTTGADRPGGKGTITTYEWQKVYRGLSVPRSIKVAEIGQNVLIGSTTLIEVQLSNVSVLK